MDKRTELAAALVDCKADDTIRLDGTVADLKSAFRFVRNTRQELKGRWHIGLADRPKGLNVRRVDVGDAAAMRRVFDAFALPQKESISRPMLDTERGAVVATNGWQMLVCDLPSGLDVEAAGKAGFQTDQASLAPWWRVANDRDNTPYALSGYVEMAEVRRGDALHSSLAALAECGRSYRHTDGGMARVICSWLGCKQYNPIFIYDCIAALFRLGCDSVKLMEIAYADGSPDRGSAPLHMVGFGDDLRARALLMPIRFPSTECGGFVMPENGTSRKAA